MDKFDKLVDFIQDEKEGQIAEARMYGASPDLWVNSEELATICRARAALCDLILRKAARLKENANGQ